MEQEGVKMNDIDLAFLLGMLAGSCITSFLIAVITEIRERIIDRRWKRLKQEVSEDADD